MSETTETPAKQVLDPEHVKVGDGMTIAYGSDRYPLTVTKVSPSGKTIEYTHDDYKMVEGNHYGPSNEQVYEFTSVEPYDEPHPHFEGERHTNVQTARWNAKRQRFVHSGHGLGAGRRAYQDPHF